MSKLYVVATPIGNLADITLRAIEVLRSVDLILSEDTRVTRKLLRRYRIEKPLESYHARSPTSKVNTVIQLLEEGKTLALVSDAGTPAISDPGGALIAAIRAHFGSVVEIVSVPGPSALTAALSVAGVPSDRFLFLGFPPHKKGRRTLMNEIARTERTVVFYESPHRILRTLKELIPLIASRTIVVSRELTKIFEETRSGTSEALLEYFQTQPEKVRGEFVVIVGPSDK